MAHILLVDDDENILEVLGSIVGTFGHTTDTATNGTEALRLFQLTAFDIGIFDIDMPEMDGLELTRRIRKLRPGFPVLLTSGYAYAQIAEQITDLQVNSFISKPPNLHELMYEIAHHLKK